MLPSSSFVKIIEVKRSLNLITVTQTDALLLTPHQIAVIVTPTTLFHEEVPLASWKVESLSWHDSASSQGRNGLDGGGELDRPGRATGLGRIWTDEEINQ